MTTPDFFIIGAMKCGTSTLHDQLAAQDGVFMSTPKEPNFFSDDDNYRRGIDWYKNVFAGAPQGAMLGESSTHYSKLPTYPDTIDRLAAYAPEAKFIYVLRHPLDRLVSHFIHAWTQNEIATDIDDALTKHEELIAYGQYERQIAPFIDRFGVDRIQLTAFEWMTASPQSAINRIGDFLGAEHAMTWRDDIAPSNISSQRIRRFPLYDLLVESPLATSIRRTIAPKALRNRIKAQFQMAERPTLSDEASAIAVAAFDKDLAALSRRLELPTALTCANYKTLVAEHPLNWRGSFDD